LFTCGVARTVMNQMFGSLRYNEGKLPVRYLGLGSSLYFF
jgi:hypothetical protein